MMNYLSIQARHKVRECNNKIIDREKLVTDIKTILNELMKNGVVIRNREFLENKIESNTLNPSEFIVNVICRGRSSGILFYKDVESFEPSIIVEKLISLSFNQDQINSILSNIRPDPHPELRKIEYF